MPLATNTWLNKIAKQKTAMLDEMFKMEPRHVDVKDPLTKKLLPRLQGEDIIYLWDKLYATDPMMKGVIVDTVVGPSTPNMDYYDDPVKANPVFPYQQLRAVVGDGGKWKWPEIWKNLDLLPRRGPAWRHIDDPSNLGSIPNPNTNIVPLKCLVVGGGPVGCRLAIELALGGHRVILWEKRREVIDEASGLFESVGFTNRVNRPHINNFCRNDLDRLNGRNFMTPKMCYPVFTNVHTSSIGIDEAQMLLMKTALLLGVQVVLGVSYENAEVDIENEQNQRPSWMVSFKADKRAQERYGKPETGEERFDALFGCDGGQSKVRVTQVDWLGTPKIRCYKKMFGIVSNLRKVSKKKLKELGYSDGLEPEDRAGGVTGIFFYKASYHNYFIVHPPSEELEANNIPWKGVFSFHKAHGQKNDEKDKLKKNLKEFMTKKAKELNIPIDETLENDGFVDAPNDVMSFDFSEFYNAEKSAACFVPPLDWDLDKDGEWEIQCPLVALAGDAVADPNWILGVGLQRGWTSAMDATFYADNLYNNKSFNGKPPDKDNPITEPIEWSEHMDNLMNLIPVLSNSSREGKLSPEMATGLLDEKGPVVNQIKRKLKDRALVPQYQVPVEPWGRYKEFVQAVTRQYRGKDLFDNIHPLTTRELAIFEKNTRWVDEGDRIKKKVTRPTAAMLTWPKRFECSAFWGMMKLLQIDGKTPPGQKPLEEAAPEEQTSPTTPIQKPKFDAGEVQEKAMRKSLSLRENALKAAMQDLGSPRSNLNILTEQQSPAPAPAPAFLAPAPAPVNMMENQLLDGTDAQDVMRRKSINKALPKGIADILRSQIPAPAPAPAAAVVAAAPRPPFPAPTHGGGGGSSSLSDPLDQAKLQHIRNEQEILRAKLSVAQQEIQLIQNSLLAYQEVEAKLLSK